MSKTRQKLDSKARENVTALVHRYVSQHPSVRDCLRDGLINLSALARAISEETGRKASISHLAVQKALQRLATRLKGVNPQTQAAVMRLVKGARVRVRTEMAVVLCMTRDSGGIVYELQRSIVGERGDFQVIDGDGFFVIITHEDYVPKIKQTMRTHVRSVVDRLAEIHLIFGEKIEVTAGVVSYVYQRLAERGINIREEMSCWTDVKLLIDERDLSRALEALDFSE